MYRNIYYSSRDSTCHLFTWNEQGKRIVQKTPYQPYFYVETNSDTPDALSIYNTRLKKKTFRNGFERNKASQDGAIKRLYHNIQVDQQFLIEIYKDVYDTPEFSKYPLKICTLDIEVNSPAEFPEAKDAKHPINLISIYDNISQKYYTWGLKPFIPKKENVVYVACTSEHDLLNKFLEFWENDYYPDILTGWNCIRHDQNIWLKDRILPISQLYSKKSEKTPLFTSGNYVNMCMKTGFKKQCLIEDALGAKIYSSEDHKFFVYSKEKQEYKNLKTLTKEVVELPLKNINLDKNNLLQVKLGQNKNPNITIKDLLLTDIDYFLDHNLFNFYITSTEIRDFVKTNNYARTYIRNTEYFWGKRFWNGRSDWTYKNLKNVVPREMFIKYITTSTKILFTNCKQYVSIDINTPISEDIMQFLGYIFTDGTLWKTQLSYTSNHPYPVAEYTEIFNTATNSNVTSSRHSNKTGYQDYTKRVTSNNIFGLLLPLIYNADSKKQPNIVLLSRLSGSQFRAFFAGLIDGDGWIEQNGISVCNYDCKKYDFLEHLHELLLWNHIISYKHDNYITIKKYDFCEKEVTDIINRLHHIDRKNKALALNTQTKTNTTSKNIKWFFDYSTDTAIVRVVNIIMTDKLVEMYDISSTNHSFLCKGRLVHNCDFFDIPYLINRIVNILGENEAKRLSPVKSLWCRKGIFVRGQELDRWYIHGISCMDYLEVYRSFSRVLLESYALNFVAEHEIGEGKLAINATNLSTLAEKDWDNFVEYNIHDVHLLVKMEEKLQFFKIIRMLAYKGLTNFEAALGKVAIVTGAVALEAYKHGMIIPTFTEGPIREAIEGGFVREPERGLQKAIVSYDANSLYPNTIITLNISPETKVGKIVNKDDTGITIRLASNKDVKLSIEDFTRFIQNEQVAISRANVLYTQKKKGIVPSLIDRLYNERVTNRKQYVSFKRQLSKLTVDTAEHIECKGKMERADTIQHVIKILLNSIYGVFANKYSPICDSDHAGSITLTGQAVVKQASEIIDQYAREKFNYTGKSLTIYNDTDSTHTTVQPLIDITKLELFNNNKVTAAGLKFIDDEIGVYLNTKIKEWAKDKLNSSDPRYFFKRESICDVGVYLEKKRYIIHVLNDEGADVNKFKYVGVEIARSTTPKKAKELIKKVIESSLLAQDQARANVIYHEVYETFKHMSIDDVAIRGGLSDLEKGERKSDGFSIGKGTPNHVKGALFFNQLLKHYNVESKYERISSGNKVKKVYVEPNRFNVDTLCYLNVFPTEFSDFHVDYQKMFDTIIKPPVKAVYTALNWYLPQPNNEEQTDLFKLFS